MDLKTSSNTNNKHNNKMEGHSKGDLFFLFDKLRKLDYNCKTN